MPSISSNHILSRISGFGRVLLLAVGLILMIFAVPRNALAGDATSTSITLNWTAPGDDGGSGTATEYDIRYLTSPLSEENWDQAVKVADMPAPQAAGHAERVTVSGLIPETDYYFAVKTADEVPNWSTVSNIMVGRTLDEPLPPPEGISPSDQGVAENLRPYLIVGNVIDPEGDPVTYYFEVSIYSDFSTLAAQSEAIPAGAEYTSWQVSTELLDGMLYYWRARVFNGSAYGEWMTPMSFTVNIAGNNNPPGVPVAYYPANGDTATLSPLWLVWYNAADPEDDQIFYQVELYDSAGTALLLFVSGIGQGIDPFTSFTPQYQFAADVWYRWRIRAFDGGGYSSWTNPVAFYYIEQTPPEAVNDLIAATGDNIGDLILTWTVPRNAHHYQIVYSRDTLTEANRQEADIWPTPPVPLPAGEIQTFTLTGLDQAGEYWVAMVVFDEVNNASELSNIANGIAGFDFGADVDDDTDNLPTEFSLSQNYPNPFNPTTMIEYSLPSEAHVSISIFNVLGQLVAKIVDEIKPAGAYSVTWNGTDAGGNPVVSGVYTYRVWAGSDIDTRKMVLLK